LRLLALMVLEMSVRSSRQVLMRAPGVVAVVATEEAAALISGG